MFSFSLLGWGAGLLESSLWRLWPRPSMLMINYFYTSRIVDSIMHLNTVILSFIPKYKNDNVICHFAFYICFLL